MNGKYTQLSHYWYIWLFTLLVFLVGITWGNYIYVKANPGGHDFLAPWVATRALLVDGISPYSDEVVTRIKTLADDGQEGYELRDVLPLYSMYIYLPYALVSEFTLARALWMTTLEVVIVWLAFLSLRLTRWKLEAWMMPIYLFFAVFWYYSLQPLISGNVIILVTLLISMALAALRSGRDELVGILLAFATIKIQVIFPILLLILIWALSQHRWRPILWLLISLGLLSASVALFLPNWPLQYLRVEMNYANTIPTWTPGAIFATWLPATGRTLGWVLSGVLVLLLIIEWGIAVGKEFRWFLWTSSLTLVASQWIGLKIEPVYSILLFLPLVLTWAVWEEHGGRKGRLLTGLVMVILFAGLWALFLQTGASLEQPRNNPILMFALPLYLLIALYWVRWWAIRPARLLIENLLYVEE